MLAVAVAAWTVIGAPKSYISTASVWVDTGGANGATLGNPNPSATPPAQQEQSVLQELLATKGFLAAVGSASTLQSYLKTHTTSGSGPSSLLKSITGSGGALDTRVASAVAHGVSSTVPGAQVLDLSFSGPSASVARSALAGLVSQLQVWTNRFSQINGQNEASYYQAQVNADEQALKTAQTQAQTYLAQNPRAAATSDPVYSSLVGVVTTDASQLAGAQSSLAAARSDGTSAGTQSLVVHEIDSPSIPTGPTKGKKTEAEGILGGLVAGIVISLLIVVLLTRTAQQPQPQRRPVPVSQGPAAEPIEIEMAVMARAAIPEAKQPAALNGGSKTKPRETQKQRAARTETVTELDAEELESNRAQWGASIRQQQK